MFAPPMQVACRVYDQGAEAHPDLDDRDLHACLRARLAEQRRRVARQRRRERRKREDEEEAAAVAAAAAARKDEEDGEENGDEVESLFVFAPAHAGWLIKRGSGGLRIWRRRWVGLDANRRLWYASGPSEKGAEGAIGRMELTQWSRVIEEVPGGDSLTFRVVPGGPEDELRAVAGDGLDAAVAAAVAAEEDGDSAGAPSSSEEEHEGDEEPGQVQGQGYETPRAAAAGSRHHRRGSSGGAGNGTGSATPPPAPQEGWLFRAESAQEKAAWVTRLNECIALAAWWGGLRFGPALGEGGFSQVFEMVDMQRGERLAVKVMEARSRMERDQAVAETEILASIGQEIRHPHLMAPRRVYVEGNRAWLMFPLCRGGDLFHRLHAKGRMPEPDAAVLLHRLLGAVSALHAHGILHLDIKPENVLFASPGPEEVDPRHVQLTDFGLSRRVHHLHKRGRSGASEEAEGEAEEDGDGEDGDALLEQDWDYLARLRYNLEFDQRLNGTIGYMSPEVVLHKRYGPAADVWSLGVVLHILLVGRSPWQPPRPATPKSAPTPRGWEGEVDGSGSAESDPHRAILARSVKGHYSTDGPEWDRVSEGARDLVRRMLCVDDNERVSTAEALAHPWLAEAAAAAAAEAAAMASLPALRKAGSARGQQEGQQRRGRPAAGPEGAEEEAEWVHTPSGEGAGGLRSLLDAAWCRGASFIASITPQGATGGANSSGHGGIRKGPGVTHSGSGSDTTISTSSSVSS